MCISEKKKNKVRSELEVTEWTNKDNSCEAFCCEEEQRNKIGRGARVNRDLFFPSPEMSALATCFYGDGS